MKCKQPFSIKLWARDTLSFAWYLYDELEADRLPQTEGNRSYFYHNGLKFKLEESTKKDDSTFTCYYKQVNFCSRCHKRPKITPSLIPSVWDNWCDDCYATTPLKLRSRKTSRAELKSSLNQQQKAAKLRLEKKLAK